MHPAIFARSGRLRSTALTNLVPRQKVFDDDLRGGGAPLDETEEGPEVTGRSVSGDVEASQARTEALVQHGKAIYRVNPTEQPIQVRYPRQVDLIARGEDHVARREPLPIRKRHIDLPAVALTRFGFDYLDTRPSVNVVFLGQSWHEPPLEG